MAAVFQRMSKRAARCVATALALTSAVAIAAACALAPANAPTPASVLAPTAELMPASALAGQYHVYSCRTPSGEICARRWVERVGDRRRIDSPKTRARSPEAH